MKLNRVKSFTLAEMLVVMIITAIVVGLAFSVLSLVQRQIRGIQKNFSKTTELSLLEQRLWQDFNQHNSVTYQDRKITLLSDNDTVYYDINETFVLRNADTLHTKITISKTFNNAKEVPSGTIDAISISAEAEIPEYRIFVYSNPDATTLINQDGF